MGFDFPPLSLGGGEFSIVGFAFEFGVVNVKGVSGEVGGGGWVAVGVDAGGGEEGEVVVKVGSGLVDCVMNQEKKWVERRKMGCIMIMNDINK